jgi:hypothetical protein
MFESIVEFPLRSIPALAMAVGGLGLAAHGTRLGWDWARHHDSEHNLRFVRGFRFAVIGLTLIAVAAAWQWHILWLFVLALAIASEEILESSIHAHAIRRGLRLDAERAAARSVSRESLPALVVRR